jgi:omega-hydroxy-beta-dihydromenaquinone-9 sulfotransferase
VRPRGPIPDGDDSILGIYTEMYDAFFEERGLAPEGRLCEVGYEDLERDPSGVVGSIYESLGLAGFEDTRPRLETYLDSISGYKKNRHPELDARTRPRVAEA